MKKRTTQHADQAFDLRKQGASYREIGRALGTTGATAHEYVRARLAELRAVGDGAVDDLRRLDAERCDALIAGAWPAASKGDPPSAAIVLRVLERRAKLYGLDAPTKLAATDTQGNDLPRPDLTKLSDADLLRLREILVRAS